MRGATVYPRTVMAVVFAVLSVGGLIWLADSRAATSVAVLEAESGITSVPASQAQMSGASGGRAVRFNAATTPPTPPDPTALLFNGDFETGDLLQWPDCDTRFFPDGSDACSKYDKSWYSIRTVTSPVRQGKYAARFEVRNGDESMGGERAEVSNDTDEAGAPKDGAEAWYQWSLMFAPGMPSDKGWGATFTQWHDTTDGSPPVSIGTEPQYDQEFGLHININDAAGKKLRAYDPWKAPMEPGRWHDLKLHIKWSADAKSGFYELWHNGVKQSFTEGPAGCKGQTKCFDQTYTPGSDGIFWKQGYYRDDMNTATGVVYIDGGSIARTEAGLLPLR